MTKDEFKIYAKHAIHDITNRIDELRQRANTIEKEIEIEFNDEVESLIQSRDELTRLAEQLDTTKEDTWEEVKQEFSKGLEYLKLGFDKLFNILSN